MSPLPTVVVVAGDAGGAAALAPVLRRLMSDGRVSVRAFAYRQAVELWGRERIAFEPAPGPSCDAALDEALAPAAVLLTGTSVNEQQIENRFIRCANQRGVPAIAVMDFWSNYRRRFCDAKDGWMCRPDLVAVMDERARRDMLREGFDEAQLVVTGQPAWDDLAARRCGHRWESKTGPCWSRFCPSPWRSSTKVISETPWLSGTTREASVRICWPR